MNETQVEVSGPARDRRWMLVDEDGICLTQRTQPRMTLIAPQFDGDELAVKAPEMPALRVRPWTGEGEWFRARIWHDELRLPEPDPAYSEWFAAFLGQACRLLYQPDSVVRPIEAPYDTAPWRVSLADSFPLLLIGKASLDLLNQKLESPVTMERFRPNLVITGSAAHEEDSWRRLRIGKVELNMAKLCTRCAIPLVDPVTAETGVEPLRTLAGYRRKPDSSKVLFGHKAVVTKPGLLQVGAEVEVVEVADQPTPAATGSRAP